VDVEEHREADRGGTGDGDAVRESTVRLQVRALGYSLQANRKTREGAEYPDRDRQFEHIATVTGAALGANQPVLSVDTKKKELIAREYKKVVASSPAPASRSRSRLTTSPTSGSARRSHTGSTTSAATRAG
jgi:hypothetical protein